MEIHDARAPTWFRYGVIALAVVIMCSCSAAVPAKGAEPRSSQSIAQASCPPQGCVAPPCPADACCPLNCNEGSVRGPSDEWLCDGGDYNLPAAVTRGGRVDGLEQEDTVAHYDTIDGRTVITPSNKVCIYAPRFAVVRQVIDLREMDRYVQVQGALQDLSLAKVDDREHVHTTLQELKPRIDRAKQPPSLLRERANPGELGRDARVATTVGSLAPYCDIQTIRTGEVVGRDIVKIARSSLAAIQWSGDQAAQVLIDNRRAQAEVSELTPGTIYQLKEPNNPKLRLIKLASKGEAAPGEEVEFTLRFDNIGDRVIGNVTIVDSLTTRLEYVDGSQKSSVKAEFKTEPNSCDSLVLRWEIAEPVQPSKGGVLQFRCKVR